jgi:hypothetical protein
VSSALEPGVDPYCECAAGLFCDSTPDRRGSPPRCMPAVPCLVEGRTYQPGETFQCECNTCTCVSGERVGSTLLYCTPVKRP